MSNYLWRVASAAIAHPTVPARARPRLLREAGHRVGQRLEMYSGAHLGSPDIGFGDDVFVNHGLFYDGEAPAFVGDRVAFGPHVSLITATHEIGGARRRCSPTPQARPIVIESGCWLGAGVIVLPGVTIRAGCVIAAAALVSAGTEPNGLYRGMPARRGRELE